jgi:hypothetical protein
LTAENPIFHRTEVSGGLSAGRSVWLSGPDGALASLREGADGAVRVESSAFSFETAAPGEPVPVRLLHAGEADTKPGPSDPPPAPVPFTRGENAFEDALRRRDAWAWERVESLRQFLAADELWSVPEDTRPAALGGIRSLPGGGFVLHEPGGAEIVVADGRVRISAPRGVETVSAGSVVTLAGDDFVAKARNSVDLSATERDVRIKAQRNLHAYSASGVLIESGADGDDHQSDGRVGEDVVQRGVVIRADRSRVFLHGATLHLSAVREVILHAVDRTAGAVRIVARTITGAAETTLLQARAGTALLLDGATAVLAGAVAMMSGASSAGVVEAGQQHVPFTRVAAEGDAAGAASAAAESKQLPAWDDYEADDRFLKRYALDEVDALRFTFRTSAQCGTEQLQFVEPLWMARMRTGELPADTAWAERQAGGDDRPETLPWPGAEAYGRNILRTLAGEVNISAGGVPAPYAERVGSGDALETRTLHDMLAAEAAAEATT